MIPDLILWVLAVLGVVFLGVILHEVTHVFQSPTDALCWDFTNEGVAFVDYSDGVSHRQAQGNEDLATIVSWLVVGGFSAVVGFIAGDMYG